MRVLRYWRLGLGAALALSVSFAFAGPSPYPECDHKATPADLEGAKGAHKAASQFYDRGDYDKAVGYWNDAYRFDCTAHSVLINIGNAYEKKGEKQAAIAAFETYLKRSGPDSTIEEKVKNLKQSLLPPVPSGAPSVDPSATPSASASASTSASASASAVPSVTPPPTVPRPYGAAPWVVVGGGAAAVVAGAILVPIGLDQVSAAEKACPNRKCSAKNQGFIDSGNSGRIKAGVGVAALAVGGVAVAGGLVWQFMFNKPQEPAASTPAPGAPRPPPGPMGVRVSPVLAPGQAGLSVTGAF